MARRRCTANFMLVISKMLISCQASEILPLYLDKSFSFDNYRPRVVSHLCVGLNVRDAPHPQLLKLEGFKELPTVKVIFNVTPGHRYW